MWKDLVFFVCGFLLLSFYLDLIVNCDVCGFDSLNWFVDFCPFSDIRNQIMLISDADVVLVFVFCMNSLGILDHLIASWLISVVIRAFSIVFTVFGFFVYF